MLTDCLQLQSISLSLTPSISLSLSPCLYCRKAALLWSGMVGMSQCLWAHLKRGKRSGRGRAEGVRKRESERERGQARSAAVVSTWKGGIGDANAFASDTQLTWSEEGERGPPPFALLQLRSCRAWKTRAVCVCVRGKTA